jgi:hypothetical protein
MRYCAWKRTPTSNEVMESTSKGFMDDGRLFGDAFPNLAMPYAADRTPFRYEMKLVISRLFDRIY